MKRILFILFFPVFTALSFAQSTIDHGGYVDLYYMARLSDNSLINIPYRIFNINVDHQNGDFSIKSTLSLEHQLRSDTYFLTNNSPQDFHWDLRELYMQWFTSFGEIRIGKQIHAWGSADENSPIDVVNPLDYYYLFSAGAERKLATFSTATDLYINNTKLGFVFSPVHNTHRTPGGDDDFPISIPIAPDPEQIFEIDDNPYEIGGFINQTFNFGDVTFSYFQGYDRIFNLTGVNVYGRGPDLSFSHIDILFGYRKTSVMGAGSVLLLGDVTLRGDLGYFDTQDQNTDINQASSFFPETYDSLHFSYPLHEESKYYQTTFQLEYTLPFDIRLTCQFFTYDTLSYSSDSLPVSEQISIPNLDIDPEQLEPRHFFTPGMGASLAVLSRKAGFISLERHFNDEQLKLNLTTMLDLDDSNFDGTLPGVLLEGHIDYNMTDELRATIGLTKIYGSDDHPDGENYRFNKMEDFSHLRFELKYFF